MSTSTKNRATFHSRLGFILVSAGCAVGLGNVWKFPYICGENGGGAFLIIYLLCLLLLGLPIVICEFAIGRGSRRSISQALNILEQPGSRWHITKYAGIAGNYLLMMFYTMVAGWMLYYAFLYGSGKITAVSAEETSGFFSRMLDNPGLMILFAAIVIASASASAPGSPKRHRKDHQSHDDAPYRADAGACGELAPAERRRRRSEIFPRPQLFPSERKRLRLCGIRRYDPRFLYPERGHRRYGDLRQLSEKGTAHHRRGDQRSGTGYLRCHYGWSHHHSGVLCLWRPAGCWSVSAVYHPANVFHHMVGGRIWGCCFFVFMSFAALSTVIAVFENIITMTVELGSWTRKKSLLVNLVLIFVLSLPAILGFNLLSGFQPFGDGSSVMDLEDFLVSYNILPLGSLVYVLFCVRKNGWGWEKFLAEVNEGTGLKLPGWLRGYMAYVVPTLICLIYLKGYYDMFAGKGTGTLIGWMAFAVLLLAVIFWVCFSVGKKPAAKAETKSK